MENAECRMQNAECRISLPPEGKPCRVGVCPSEIMQNAELIDNNYSVIPKSRAFFGDYTNA